MPHERTVTAQVPKAARNRVWQAAALLEAPDVNGQPGTWKAIEAVPGETEIVAVEVSPGETRDVAVPTGVVADTITSRHAEHNPGWYRLQWYDTGQNSKYSKPVRLADGEDAGTAGRWN